MKIIPHNRPCIDSSEKKAIDRILDSGWLIMGREVEKFEESIKKIIHIKYVLAVNSGLSALHLSLHALGVSEGDEVIVPSYTCIALLHAINYVGAKPIVADIEEDGFNMDPELTRKKISKKTKAIILPHQHGFPAKIDEIKKLGVAVIEDCALAIGASYKNRPLGSYGNISIFSFYATKMVSMGQGGMIVTNNKKYYEKVDSLLHQRKFAKEKKYALRYNYQLTDIAAAIGNTQLHKLNSHIKKRKEIGRKYQEVLRTKKSVNFFPKKGDRESNYYRFLLEFKNEKERNIFSKKLLEKEIVTSVPIPTHEALHNLLGLRKKDFPNTQKRCRTILSIPVFPCLNEGEVEKITNALDALLV